MNNEKDKIVIFLEKIKIKAHSAISLKKFLDFGKVSLNKHF